MSEQDRQHAMKHLEDELMRAMTGRSRTIETMIGGFDPVKNQALVHIMGLITVAAGTLAKEEEAEILNMDSRAILSSGFRALRALGVTEMQLMMATLTSQDVMEGALHESEEALDAETVERLRAARPNEKRTTLPDDYMSNDDGPWKGGMI
jgi:hypothetical protein